MTVFRTTLPLAFALLAAPAFAQATTVASCGTNFTYEDAPERAVTLNQQATEIMLALGLERSMVGTAYLDDAVPERWQEAYDSIPVLAEEYPAREVVLAQDPDFLFAGFASAFGEDALGAQVEWQDLGIGTYLVNAECRNEHPADEPITTEPLFIDLARIGSIFDIEERTTAYADALRGRFAAVADANPGAGRTAFLYDSGTDTALTAGCCGTPALLLRAVGLENIAADVEGRWADLAWEAVATADPDLIVLIDAAWSTAEEKIDFLKSDPVLSELDAVVNDRFVTVPFSETVLGVRFIDGVERLGAALEEMGGA